MSTRNHSRADGQVTLSISLPEPLKQRIAAAARKENRPVSNWFCTHVEKLLEDTSSRFLLNETAEKTLQEDGEFTPAKHRGKYQTAAKTRAERGAGAKMATLSENLDCGSLTPTKKNSRRAG